MFWPKNDLKSPFSTQKWPQKVENHSVQEANTLWRACYKMLRENRATLTNFEEELDSISKTIDRGNRQLEATIEAQYIYKTRRSYFIVAILLMIIIAVLLVVLLWINVHACTILFLL